MQIRRCAILYLEPRETLGLDLNSLLSGGEALTARIEWIALAPHVGKELALNASQLEVLDVISETLWQDRGALDQRFGSTVVDNLLSVGLLIGQSQELNHFRERDEAVRALHWRPMFAVSHFFSRWEGIRCDEDPRLSRASNLDEMVSMLGTPPAETIERGPADSAIALPPPKPGPLDEIFLRRYTGRNFDPQAIIPRDVFSRLLQRCFGAQQRWEYRPDTVVFKKNSPSGGGLHPIEAYVLAQRVEGVATGLYHYHPLRHALEPIKALAHDEAAELALRMVANQPWFADAPFLVVLSARVKRNFWKYRNHAKSYRVLQLDAGHLSQTFYLLAAEAGMPAFITAAINEVDIEQALSLDPLADVIVAICGCGPVADENKTVELRYDNEQGTPTPKSVMQERFRDPRVSHR